MSAPPRQTNALPESLEKLDLGALFDLARSIPRVNSAQWEAQPIQEIAPLFPDYTDIQLIARGGMGAVYKARQKRLDRLVAIKILPPEVSYDSDVTERFRREARALAKLQHPNIVAIHDFGLTLEGSLYYIMEFVEGRDLAQVMREAPIELATTIKLLSQICDALEYAHSQGVIHRDVKPSNILITKELGIKVADFGLALIVDDCALSRVTRVTTTLGTYEYAAPEQAHDGRKADRRSDVYSLGVVAYECLTGALPQGVFDAPSQRSNHDPAFDPVILRALSADPARRQQTVAEFKSELIAAHESALITGSAEVLGSSQAQILEDFYRKALLGLPPQAQFFIEDELLTASGYRDSRALDDAAIPRETLQILCDRRLLRLENRGGIPRVELSHDRLTGVVQTSRDARRLRDERAEAARREAVARALLQRRNLVAATFALLTLVAAVAGGYGWFKQREATSAQRLAAHNHEEAEKLIGFMVQDLQRRLDEIGRMDVLETVIDRVEQYYKSYSDLEATPEGLSRKALFYRNRGQMHRLQGAYAEAIKDLQIAVELSERAWRADPGNLERSIDLGHALQVLGRFYSIKQDFPPSLEAQTRSRQIFAKLYQKHPEDPRVQFYYAKASRFLGEIQANSGDLASAETNFQECDRHIRALAEQENPRTEWLAEWASNESEFGSLRERQGDFAQAFLHFEKMRQIAEKNIPAGRWDAVLQAQHSGSLSRAGGMLLKLNRADEAIAYYKKAEKILEQQFALSPESTHFMMEARFCYNQLAIAYYTKGDKPLTEHYKELMSQMDRRYKEKTAPPSK